MKKLNILFILIFLEFFANAQVDLTHTGSLIQGGVRDGVKLVTAYITPLNRSLMVGMNNTEYSPLWFKDEKRFSISLRTSIIAIPDIDKTFNVNNLHLEKITVDPNDPASPWAQTVFGDTTVITLVSRDSTIDSNNNIIPGDNDNGDDNGGDDGGGLPFGRSIKTINGIDSIPVFTLHSIPGSGIGMMPIPYLNISYKLNFGTISAGVLPYVSDSLIAVLGSISWTQGLTSLIPSFRDKPFQVSVMAGYYHFYVKALMNIKPEGVSVPLTLNGKTTGPYDTQRLLINFSSFYTSVYASYRIKKITFWAGLGYNKGFSHIQIVGNYPVYASDPSGTASVVAEDVTDPMDESDSYARTKADFGIRLDIKRWYIQANYTLASYGGFGTTLGIRF